MYDQECAGKQVALPLLLEESHGIRRMREPVTVGMPLPKGVLAPPLALALSGADGQPLPVQAETLATWSDGSVRWVLLDFQVSLAPGERRAYRLHGAAHPVTDGPTVTVQRTPEQVVVDTGAAVFGLNTSIFKPFDTVVVQGTGVLDATESGVVLVDAHGQEYTPYIDHCTVETAGPLRTTLRIEGMLRAGVQGPLARFVARVSFYAGKSGVTVQFTLHNPRAAEHPGGLWDLGDAGAILFRELSMHVALQSPQERTWLWSSQPQEPLRSHSGPQLAIYQDSSGGKNWHSTNHVNRHGKVMLAFAGYRVTAADCLVHEGQRAAPMLAVTDGTCSVTVAIDKFWQNFPKALEGRGNRLSLGLFPRQYGDVHELQGGEQKTHTMFVQFASRQTDTPDIRWFHGRLLPRTTPEWYAQTQAIRYLTPSASEPHTDYQALVDTAILGPQTFFDRRECIDEYGWRHFGDLYADHEAIGHQGPTPLVSHYNNQYDVIYGAAVQYARSGEPRWFQLMAELARHVIDIDIYHTEADRPVYNHGLFWHTDHYADAATATHRTYSRATVEAKGLQYYGGGVSNEHNYTSGLLHYYWLTGDATAREAVEGLANWVINMDNGSHRRLGWLDRRPTGACSATVSREYHGPGRGAGNSINALLDAAILTGQPCYLGKAESLIRRCIHPHDNIAARQLEEVEYRWSYTVFLQVLGKYLDVKAAAGEIDYMYSYARASLLHYAAWMLTHEVPYKQVLHKVALPTETWPAQDIRKCNVFNFAAKHATEPLRQVFLQRAAGYFFRACITDLRSFETCQLTRPTVLLMTNGYMQAYFAGHPAETAALPQTDYDFGTPQQRFRPQFYELYKMRDILWHARQVLQAIKQRLGGTA